MAAEIQALVIGFKYAFMVKELVAKIIGRKIKIEAMPDSKTDFNVVAKYGQTTERRLQIECLTLHQNMTTAKLTGIAWIP